MRTLFLILVRALGVIKFLIKIEFRPLNFSLKRARVDVSRQNPHLHIISHSSGVFVVIIIVVGFMGHWVTGHGYWLFFMDHCTASTRTQAAIMHACIVKHVEGHIIQVQDTQTHGLLVVKHVQGHIIQVQHTQTHGLLVVKHVHPIRTKP